jgi:hypothetical protein
MAVVKKPKNGFNFLYHTVLPQSIIEQIRNLYFVISFGKTQLIQ